MPPTAPEPVVVKLGGAVCGDPATLSAFADAWRARLDGAPSCVLVHGGGPQLDAALLALGEPITKVQGLRVTSPAAASVVLRVLDATGAALARSLRDHGLPAVHVPAALRLMAATRKALPGAESGRVGTVRAFDAAALRRCVPPGGLAVVTPVGWDAAGPLNVNADEGAAAVATALGASRLVLATDVAHVVDERGRPVVAMDSQAALTFLSGAAAHGGMLPKLQAALDALTAGVQEVTIGRLEAAWAGVGTRIGPQVAVPA